MKRLIVVAALAAIAVPTTALGAAAHHTTGTVYAHITHTVGGDLYVAGDVRDSLFGRGGIVYLTQPGARPDGSIFVKARRITLYLPGGTMYGPGSATQTTSGDTAVVSGGTFNLTKGTGKYRGHTFKGTFTGTQDKDGIYTFKYKATYR